MKKLHVISMIASLVSSFLCSGCSTETFDPTKAIRIYYESPMGCDEVSGTVILKASLRGESAPIVAKMQYKIWTDNESNALLLEGFAPDYEALFDSTTIRDGFVHFRALPFDESGKEINIKAPPYNAKGFIPSFKGFMIRNGEIDFSKPLIVMGAPLEPDTGRLGDDDIASQLDQHLVFSASLMTHLESLGFIPSFCFDDKRTVVLDPARPSSDFSVWPVAPVDMLGRSVASPVRWNPGTLCYTSPFFESPISNGIPDIWELTAFDNILFYETYGPVTSKPLAIAFFREVIEKVSAKYNAIPDFFSMFEFERPVPYEAPEDLLQKKLEQRIQEGVTAVLIYDFYNKANEFEMSSGSWPRFQEALDRANANLGTKVRLGAIATNQYQIMHYEEFYRALYSGVRYLVQSENPPANKKIGIILAAHGSSTTNRLYDISNIIHNPVMNRRIEEYFTERRLELHPSAPLCVVRYSEHANSASDGLPGVGEQVKDWLEKAYDYIFIFPMEWPWPTRDVWFELRKNATELIELSTQAQNDLYVRDGRNRSIVQVGSTVLVFGGTIFDQKDENPDAYRYLQAAAEKLLEDRMANIVQN